MKDDVTTTSNIDNQKTNFRVKLSGFPKFDRKQDSWLNFGSKFEAISETSVIEETFNEVIDNEGLNNDRIKYDEYYTGENTKM